MTARARMLSSAFVILRYADASAFSIASSSVSYEMPRSRSTSLSDSNGIFMSLFPPRRRPPGPSVPFEHRPRRPDLVVGHGHDLVVVVVVVVPAVQVDPNGV